MDSKNKSKYPIPKNIVEQMNKSILNDLKSDYLKFYHRGKCSCNDCEEYEKFFHHEIEICEKKLLEIEDIFLQEGLKAHIFELKMELDRKNNPFPFES